jgi:hypothetical protein
VRPTSIYPFLCLFSLVSVIQCLICQRLGVAAGSANFWPAHSGCESSGHACRRGGCWRALALEGNHKAGELVLEGDAAARGRRGARESGGGGCFYWWRGGISWGLWRKMVAALCKMRKAASTMGIQVRSSCVGDGADGLCALEGSRWRGHTSGWEAGGWSARLEGIPAAGARLWRRDRWRGALLAGRTASVVDRGNEWGRRVGVRFPRVRFFSSPHQNFSYFRCAMKDACYRTRDT